MGAYLKTCFRRVRFGSLCTCVALSASLSTGFAWLRAHMLASRRVMSLQEPEDGMERRVYLCRRACLMFFERDLSREVGRDEMRDQSGALGELWKMRVVRVGVWRWRVVMLGENVVGQAYLSRDQR